MPEISQLFDSTFDALDRSLTVDLITEWNLITGADETEARARFEEREDISQVPIRSGNRIVGVWFREDGFRTLDEMMLISDATPISQFIPMTGAFRLVLKRGAIDGIVTRSDLNKLPVRLLSFGLITHLELQMACLIETRHPSDSWLSLLDPRRREDIEKRFKRDLAGPDWEGRTTRLGCTFLTDKFKILGEEPDFGADLAADQNEINLLRKKLAHSDNYVWDDEPLENFCKRYELAQSWVARLHQLLVHEEEAHRSGAAAGSDQ